MPTAVAKKPLRRLAAFALALAVVGALVAVPSAESRAPARAHAASSYITGIGDEQATMFASPLWQQLHTKIVRYIVPYDVAVHKQDLSWARAWIGAAEAAHQQVLVAFYHSRRTPLRLPSVGEYKADVTKFLKLFPRIHQFQSWDEANRGYIPGLLASPSAYAAAAYYQALLRSCRRCTVIGLDVLDANNISGTLEYIREFKSAIGRLRTVMPSIWGLHNYSDVNRFQTWRTHELVNALGGQVWLTETGGLVQFGGAFPNYGGSGLQRAARALRLMFALAASDGRIKRLYIYNWTGGNAGTRFDAGLTNYRNQPRAGYVVVCRQLRAARCSVRTASN